jgi:hypothetical protein
MPSRGQEPPWLRISLHSSEVKCSYPQLNRDRVQCSGSDPGRSPVWLCCGEKQKYPEEQSNERYTALGIGIPIPVIILLYLFHVF